MICDLVNVGRAVGQVILQLPECILRRLAQFGIEAFWWHRCSWREVRVEDWRRCRQPEGSARMALHWTIVTVG